VKFLSVEPLLGAIPDLDLTDIDWVIVGGESGPGARPMDPAWVTDPRDQCRDRGVAFSFKQWGGVNKKKAGRLLEGQTWDEMPTAASRDRHPAPSPAAAQLELGGMTLRKAVRR
jgi:protein gp37